MDGIKDPPTNRPSKASTYLVLLVVWVTLLSLLAALTPAAAALAPGGVGAATGAARGGWAAAVAAVDPRCHPDVEGTAAAAASGGTVHGFARWAIAGSDCRDDRAWYFQGRRGHWTQSRSPYRGEMLAVAVDRTGTYLLYFGGQPTPDRVLLGKRLHNGRYLAPRLLSRLQGAAVNTGVQGAGLVAAGGKWWAVWSQGVPADPTAPPPPAMLFQAKTIGGAQATRQITFRPAQNLVPVLALTRDRRHHPSGALLAWSNGKVVPQTGGGFVEIHDIRLARAGLSGRWSSRLVSPGPYDVQFAGSLAWARGTTYLAWDREHPDVGEATRRVRFTDDPGVSPPHVFRTPGGGPKLAVKGTTVYLMWQTLDPNAIFVARRTAGSWTGEAVRVTAGPTEFQIPLLLTVTAPGKLTALVLRVRSGVFAVTQR